MSNRAPLSIAALLLALILVVGPVPRPALPDETRLPLRLDQGCTVFYAADEQVSLGGNNEDYRNPLTKVWFVPARGGQYGRVYFGFDDFWPQGGMNDQGLFFDGLGIDERVPVPRAGRSFYPGNLLDKAMAECATVECVLSLFERYHLADVWSYQFLFGDSAGDSAIVEPLTALRKEGRYQVATNFYQSTTPLEDRTCWRYRTAVRMLESAEAFSVDVFRDILDAVHVEGQYPTLYSNVCDLKRKTVYLYYFHDYEHVVVLDLQAELEKGAHAHDIASLFPPNEAAERWARPILQKLTPTAAAPSPTPARPTSTAVGAMPVEPTAIPAEPTAPPGIGEPPQPADLQPLLWWGGVVAVASLAAVAAGWYALRRRSGR